MSNDLQVLPNFHKLNANFFYSSCPAFSFNAPEVRPSLTGIIRQKYITPL